MTADRLGAAATTIQMMPIGLVIFDLDGTLIDSRRDLADATNAMIADYGGPALSLGAVTAMVGEGAPVLVKRALTAAGLDPCAGRARALLRTMTTGSRCTHTL